MVVTANQTMKLPWWTVSHASEWRGPTASVTMPLTSSAIVAAIITGAVMRSTGCGGPLRR